MFNGTVEAIFVVQSGASVSGFMHTGRGLAVLEECWYLKAPFASIKSGSVALQE